MIRMRSKGCGSWLDARSFPALACALRERLSQRLEGERALFITLTYRRDDFESPRALYERQSEEQHVPIFLRKLARRLGCPSFRGRWIRKMEFQTGGWVHFHLILIWPTAIPHAILTECWGHGHVWVNWCSAERREYLTKYVAKWGSCPAWLLGEKPKSVKIFASSPGFWLDTAPREASEPNHDPWRKLACYVPIGERIEEAQRRVLVKTEQGWDQVRGDVLTISQALKARGHRVRYVDGWVYVNCDAADLYAVTHSVRAERRAAGLPAAAAGVHLIRERNPDTADPEGWPIWLRELVIDELLRSEGAGWIDPSQGFVWQEDAA